MSRLETSYSNKPYFFAPLMESANRQGVLNRQSLLKTDSCAGRLQITAECITPMHFGSGQLSFDEKNNCFTKQLMRENGRIVLPGSSFKGMLRSVFEAVTASCVVSSPKSRNKEKDLTAKIGGLTACSHSSNLCPACSVFGRLSYKGKLIVGSFYTDNEPVNLSLPLLEQPFKTYPPPLKGEKDNRTGNERLYYGDFNKVHGLDVARMSKDAFWENKKRKSEGGSNFGGNFYGRKFYKHSRNWKALTEKGKKDIYECLDEGAVLTGCLTYQGLSEDELGALLFALGLGWGQQIFHKLGYAKPAFLGSVKLTVKPEPLLRYEQGMVTLSEAEEAAVRYYVKHETEIETAVEAIRSEWAGISDAMWVFQDGKYGY